MSDKSYTYKMVAIPIKKNVWQILYKMVAIPIKKNVWQIIYKMVILKQYLLKRMSDKSYTKW